MTLPRGRTVGAAVLVLLLLVGVALVSVGSQRESRRQLEQQFELRNTLSASFTSSFVRSVVETERRSAQASLARKRVSEGSFRDVVAALGFQAVLLLDSGGRVLDVWPPKQGLVGTEIASRYAHLARAVSGKVGISNVVPSAARRLPVVAFAVPFGSVLGRRVFSGAFVIGATPLATYLRTALPFSGGELSLVDQHGLLVISNRPGSVGVRALKEVDAPLAALVGDRTRGTYLRRGELRFFARHAISGTPWQLVVSVPERQLFAPINGTRALLPWLLLAALALTALSTAFLIRRLSDNRARLAASNRHLAHSNEELRDLDRLKDEFVALVSHELRTPLTSIIGYVSALQRGRAGVVPAEQGKLLEVVERNAERLLRLVGDLLVTAKADAGKLNLEPELLQLDELVRQAVDSARPHADAEGVGLSLQASGVAPLFADRGRLVQVLDNLLSNAVKFSPAGGIVGVSLSSDGSFASIEVSDSGIGIPAEEQEQLFRRFFRGSTATCREIPGTGLGLSIVKTIVDLHHGTVAFSSREGAGTTFTVTLPLASAEEAAA